MSLNKRIEQAFDEIDAAVFSGDTFDFSENKNQLMYFIDRWTRELSGRENSRMLTGKEIKIALEKGLHVRYIKEGFDLIDDAFDKVSLVDEEDTDINPSMFEDDEPVFRDLTNGSIKVISVHNIEYK